MPKPISTTQSKPVDVKPFRMRNAAGYSSSALPMMSFVGVALAEPGSTGALFASNAAHYCAKYDGSLEAGGKVKGFALTDLPKFDIRAGVMAEIDAALAHDLAHTHAFDPKARNGNDAGARRKRIAAYRKYRGVVVGQVVKGEMVPSGDS